MKQVYLLTGRSTTKDIVPLTNRGLAGEKVREPSKEEDFEIRFGDAGENPELSDLYELKLVGRAKWDFIYPPMLQVIKEGRVVSEADFSKRVDRSKFYQEAISYAEHRAKQLGVEFKDSSLEKGERGSLDSCML